MSAPTTCVLGHSKQIGILCRDCGDFVFFRREFRSDRTTWPLSPDADQRHLRVGPQIATLLIAGAGAVFLFRLTGLSSVVYGFVVLGLVNLYGMVLSRSRALTIAAVAAAMFVLAWGAWATFGTTYIGVADRRWIFLGTWAIMVGYAITLGLTTTLATVRIRATYLLALITLVSGLWLGIAVDLQYHLDLAPIVDGAIVVAVLLPLGFIITSVKISERGAIASYLTAISCYATVIQYLVTGLNYALTYLAPRAIGVSVTGPRPAPAWLVILEWKSVVSAILGVAAVALVIASSIFATARNFDTAGYTFFAEQISASRSRFAYAPDPLSRTSEQVYRAALQFARTAYLVALFVTLSVFSIAITVWSIVKTLAGAIWTALRYLAVPILAISVVSILLITVVRDLTTYVDGGASKFGSPALWGGLVCVAELILLLVGAALGFAPLARDEKASFNGTQVALLLAGGYWALVSIVCLAMWPLWYTLKQLGLPVRALSLGPLIVENAVIVVVTIVALMIVVLLSGGIAGRRHSEPSPRRVLVSLAITLIAFMSFALVLGSGPLAHWLTGQA